jgi:hypothetical protein
MCIGIYITESIIDWLSFLYFQLNCSYLLVREVGTVAMGANPFAVTAEMANSKAELSFIFILLFYCVATL